MSFFVLVNVMCQNTRLELEWGTFLGYKKPKNPLIKINNILIKILKTKTIVKVHAEQSE